MRAKGCGTTPVPRLLRGRPSPPAPDGGDAAPSLDRSRSAELGSAAALVPFAPFRRQHVHRELGPPAYLFGSEELLRLLDHARCWRER